MWEDTSVLLNVITHILKFNKLGIKTRSLHYYFVDIRSRYETFEQHGSIQMHLPSESHLAYPTQHIQGI